MNVRVFGVAERVEDGAVAVTVTEIVVVFAVRPVDVPVIVTRLVPVVAPLLAVNVTELGVVVVADVGLKLAVTPVGRPDATKLTLPLKPPVPVTAIVLALLVLP